MAKLAPILKEIPKDVRVGHHHGSGSHNRKLHQTSTLTYRRAEKGLRVSYRRQEWQNTTAEPLSNLDAKLRAEMRFELKNLVKSLGVTTLYVTHDQMEALTMSDNVAVMQGGVFVEE